MSVLVGLLIYIVMGGMLAIAFVAWGSAAVRVTDSEIVAGPARLRLDQVSEVAALDPGQTSALRGPHADVRAYMLVRPYLAKSVYVAVAGRPAERPYLLIGTRRPADLAAAIVKAAPGAALPAASDAACDDDDPDDHAAEMDAIGPVDASHQRKDGNAW